MSWSRSWSREFDEPITLPDGRPTLRDAATYVTGLPKKEAALPEWQDAIQALMLVVEHGGPTMPARIGNPLHTIRPRTASGPARGVSSG